MYYQSGSHPWLHCNSFSDYHTLMWIRVWQSQFLHSDWQTKTELSSPSIVVLQKVSAHFWHWLQGGVAEWLRQWIWVHEAGIQIPIFAETFSPIPFVLEVVGSVTNTSDEKNNNCKFCYSPNQNSLCHSCAHVEEPIVVGVGANKCWWWWWVFPCL